MNDFNDFYKLVAGTRTIRRFRANFPIKTEQLRQLIDLTRMAPSGRNLQPLKYIIVNNPETCDLVFPCLKWAKDLKDWGGPAENERPVAYIIILGDTQLKDSFSTDQGICSQTIRLGASAMGLAGCIIASIKRDKLCDALDIPNTLEVLLVVALGIAGETVVINEIPDDGSIIYWRDENDIHHVPKRSLDELIVKELV